MNHTAHTASQSNLDSPSDAQQVVVTESPLTGIHQDAHEQPEASAGVPSYTFDPAYLEALDRA